MAQLKEKKSTKSENESDNASIKKLQNENDDLLNTLNKLKTDSVKAFKDRTAKKPSEFTTKSQLRTMVGDLENEISEILVVLKNSNTNKAKLEDELKQFKTKSNKNSENESTIKELDEIKKKLKDLQEELKQEKNKANQERTKCEEANKKLSSSKDSLTKANNDLEQLKTDNNKLKDNYNKLSQEKAKIEDDLKKLKGDNSKCSK